MAISWWSKLKQHCGGSFICICWAMKAFSSRLFKCNVPKERRISHWISFALLGIVPMLVNTLLVRYHELDIKRLPEGNNLEIRTVKCLLPFCNKISILPMLTNYLHQSLLGICLVYWLSAAWSPDFDALGILLHALCCWVRKAGVPPVYESKARTFMPTKISALFQSLLVKCVWSILILL